MDMDKTECLICNKSFKTVSLRRHLTSCLAKTAGEEPKDCVLIKLTARHQPHFAYLAVPRKATLDQLDELMWGLWLNCCPEHGSDFELDGEEQDLDQTLDHYEAGTRLKYTFDYSHSTEIWVELMLFTGVHLPPEGDAVLAARNRDIEYTCDQCNKAPAVKVCATCYDRRDALYCKPCSKQHQCDGGEVWWLAVANSPRMGVCGYAEIDDEDGQGFDFSALADLM